MARPENVGRKYYRCRNKGKKDKGECKFFSWEVPRLPSVRIVSLPWPVIDDDFNEPRELTEEDWKRIEYEARFEWC
jgi:hypothetical protein